MIEVELEEPCENCDGKGGWKGDGERTPEWARCGRCAGSGYIPTVFGERVLALMRHNFAPMLEDAQK